MSHSDYLKLKRDMRILKEQTDFTPVLKSSDYVLGKNYHLETTVPNLKPIYHRLTSSGNQMVFGMERTIGGSCPEFKLCSGTNARPNRVLNTDTSNTKFIMRPPNLSVPKDVSDPIHRKIATIPNADRKQKCNIKCKCQNTRCICEIVPACPL
jgi:hypothetical protein